MAPLAFCVILMGLVSFTSAHVYLANPIPRHVLDPTEYNKGGKDGNNTMYGGICGDGGGARSLQFGTRNKFGIPQGNRLKAGEAIPVKIVALAGHWGRFQFSICISTGPETPNNVNQECFDKHILQPVAGQKNITYPYPYLWLGDLSQGEMTRWYKVPSDISCDGVTTFCLLQMHYWSGTSCNPPPYCPIDVPWTKCNKYYTTCVPTAQRFRNCADVTVSTGTGGSTGVGKPPPPTTPTTAKPPPPKAAARDACCFGKRDGLHRNPRNCRLACKCQKQKTIQRLSCRANYNFDEARQKCRLARYYSCN